MAFYLHNTDCQVRVKHSTKNEFRLNSLEQKDFTPHFHHCQVSNQQHNENCSAYYNHFLEQNKTYSTQMCTIIKRI